MKESQRMKENEQTYMEKRIEATITSEDANSMKVVFQTAKLKLRDPLEIEIIHSIDQSIAKEVTVIEDEVQIIFRLPLTYYKFKEIKQKTSYSKHILAYQLVKKVQEHKLQRLHLIICPENIIFDTSYSPLFLHYGVKESIAPYELDPELVCLEIKAIVASLIDEQYEFEKYVNYHETIKLSQLAKSIMGAADLHELEEIVKRQIQELEKNENQLVHIPKRNWYIRKYTMIGLIVFFIPTLFFSMYYFLYLQPKQAAFIKSNEYFLDKRYSDVINGLENYNFRDMPFVVQYELASSYIVNESLTEKQRKTIQNMITLRTDRQYLLYWISIGRGLNKDAIDIARLLEDQDLIVYGLLKYRDEIKANNKLSGEEKEKELNSINKEIEDYKKQKEELEKQKQEKLEEEKKKTIETMNTSNEKKEGQAEQKLPTSGEKPANAKPQKQTEDGS